MLGVVVDVREGAERRVSKNGRMGHNGSALC